MALPNENIKTKDLIRPLSPEAIAYFLGDGLSLEGPTHARREGKFIRLGSVMMVGLTVRHGEADALSGEQRVLLHRDLLYALMSDEGLYGSVPYKELEAESQLKGGLDLHDAGYIHIAPQQDSFELTLGGESFDFGRADQAGRECSVEIAQALAGNTAQVISRD